MSAVYAAYVRSNRIIAALYGLRTKIVILRWWFTIQHECRAILNSAAAYKDSFMGGGGLSSTQQS